jgi:hypothetical protein
MNTDVFPFIKFYLISFRSILSFSVYKSCVLVKFILKYFVLFDGIISVIASLISFWNCALLVCRNII